ncbi:MAG TPA: glycoside hydrolase family 3 N-terminal domain-containing protein [Rugosimonospora sp.]|nr:glycoside hydrolase family 3 N-terminal domain-containing protein [Rugosimonospora sp.]
MGRLSVGGKGSGRALVAALAILVLAGLSCVVVRLMSATDTRSPLGSAPVTPPPVSPPPASPPLAESPSPAPPDSPSLTADACVESILSRLTLQERVGQLLMIGTPLADPTSITGSVRQYHLGGVFLAGRSGAPAAKLRQSIRIVQSAAATSPVPLHIALDQEGGQVQTLRGPDFPPVPSAVVQGSWDTATLDARTADWARRLASIGVTIDLAPVADVVPASIGARNPPIGAFHREYGSRPGPVGADIRTVVASVQRNGVLTTLKHFPGLGRVLANTDTSTGAVDNATSAGDPSLQPFAQGIQAGSAAVMVSSARYPRLDPHTVAAFSAPIVTGLLRQRLGYTGLVLSDDLGGAVAVSSVPLGDRAVRFVAAGGDLVLSVRSSDAGPMSRALLAAARASAGFQNRVADAVRHVLRSKYRAGLLRCPPATR